jgi:hypothetical protein
MDGHIFLLPDSAQHGACANWNVLLDAPSHVAVSISPDVRVVAAFVPVDDSHTLLYLRFYQRFLRLPGLGHLAARLAMPFNLRVAHEDRRVVVTHQPQISGLKIGESLIQGDLPIIEYRRKREEWQKQAA